MSVYPNEVKKYLKMNDEGVVRLTRKFLYPKPVLPLCKRTVLYRRARAEQYQEMIASGFCTNQADIAQHFGVSRAWVTKIMNTLKPSR
jgi:hypothetical protein